MLQNMVYKFQSKCDTDYIDQTTQRLEVQVENYLDGPKKQHAGLHLCEHYMIDR